MARKRPDPNWGQSMRYMGPAKKGDKRIGCELELILVGGFASWLGYEAVRWFA